MGGADWDELLAPMPGVDAGAVEAAERVPPPKDRARRRHPCRETRPIIDYGGSPRTFFYEEAELLDAWDYGAWLARLSGDLTYFMPMKRNVKSGEHAARERTREGRDINWFEEDKWTLPKRAEQIETGVHWAEEPLSRVCHMVSNIQLTAIRRTADAATELDIRSRFWRSTGRP